MIMDMIINLSEVRVTEEKRLWSDRQNKSSSNNHGPPEDAFVVSNRNCIVLRAIHRKHDALIKRTKANRDTG